MNQDWIGQEIGIRARTRVAVLVDCENIGQTQADIILKCAADLGTVAISRAYGDMRIKFAWEADHRFDSIHTGHGGGKNAADIRLAIDAMDLAHSGNVNSFVIASSDGDFTPLAIRLREAGFVVIGLGKEDSSQSLKHACTAYHTILKGDSTTPAKESATEIPTAVPAPAATASAVATQTVTQSKKPKLSPLDRAIREAFLQNGVAGKSMQLVKLGNAMSPANLAERNKAGKSTWRAYLKTRPDLYVIEGTGRDTSVRLTNP